MALDTKLPAGCEILILEDEPSLRKRLALHLRNQGAEVSEATKLEEARRLARDIRFDFAVVDLHLPDGEALSLLRENTFSENTGVVVMTAFGGLRKAVEAMQLGASDYLAKPFEPDELVLAFLRSRRERTSARREQHLTESHGAGDELYFGQGLTGIKKQLDTILAAERRLLNRLPPVLIEGETGTGKSALARWLHRNGPRASQPFITINCAALPEHLAESELFGHERGAFTDARQARTGLFEAADGGTLFLDEIGSLTPAAQAKVLLAVEDGRIRRLGSTKEIQIDTRLIAASNQPLRSLAETGRFREDLFQRLNLLQLTLSPLRERREDIPGLAGHLLAQIASRHRLKNRVITPQGLARLRSQLWKGNIRELAHEIERAVIFTAEPGLDFDHLNDAPTSTGSSSWRHPAWQLPEAGFSLDAAMNEFIAEALRVCDGNVSAAARRLGVTRDFLRYRMTPSDGSS
ncbi:MAG: sigma-54 dependent transcriptional regulator [Nibricoccus sp.]